MEWNRVCTKWADYKEAKRRGYSVRALAKKIMDCCDEVLSNSNDLGDMSDCNSFYNRFKSIKKSSEYWYRNQQIDKHGVWLCVDAFVSLCKEANIILE